MLSLPLWRYVLTAVLRDRVIQIMLILMVMGMSAALFLGNAAVIEKQAFTVATAATVLRILSVLGLVTFICFFVRRAFESREIDYLLATPLSRHRLLFSFSAAFITVSLILALAMAAILFIFSGHYTEGWLIWSVSAFIELSITAMIALFFSIALKSATVSVLGSLGYYSLARMLGAMIGILTNKVGDNTLVTGTISWIVKVIAVITPRFDLLSQSAWLVYGNAAGVSLWILPVQMIVFCALFFAAAAFDLRRSQF